MGARADTALAVVVVPQGLDAQVEEDMFQLLAGALPVLQAAGCALVGGHTSEGAELSLGDHGQFVMQVAQLALQAKRSW